MKSFSPLKKAVLAKLKKQSRGKFISKAVDVAEVSRRKFLVDQNITVKNVTIGSEEFENKARAVAGTLLPKVANKTFHVRIHRRGFKGRLSTIEEEKFLDTYNEEIFWEELANRLAARDLLIAVGSEKYHTMDWLERGNEIAERVEQYETELEEHGISRMKIVADKPSH